MPSQEEVRAFLTQRGVLAGEKQIEHGIQFRCKAGELVNWYEKRGKIVLGGQASELANQIKAWADGGEVSAAPSTAAAPTTSAVSAPLLPGLSRDVFVVYGHDEPVRDQLELLLRRMGLEPIILARMSGSGDTIIEKLDKYLGEHSNVGFACVLLTPDDQGHKAGEPAEIKYRARQNVILELGMVLARLGRRNTAILHKKSVELPSDIAGLIYIPFQERVDEVRTDLFKHLNEAGFKPKSDGL
jgi:predicted nucleotide-binding protein